MYEQVGRIQNMNKNIQWKPEMLYIRNGIYKKLYIHICFKIGSVESSDQMT